MGVQYSLWGGSVMNLGTEKHKKQYFDAIDKFKIPGQYESDGPEAQNGTH